jgi:hypothetical protein
MNEVIQESEMSVVCSLLNQFDKGAMILESFTGNPNDLEAFAIYQEADEASVQSGDPAGQVGAEAKKKNVFVKIWEFIKNIFATIGSFISKCWNGVTVPAVETVSEKTKEAVDKIAGKDQSWWDANKDSFKEFCKNSFGVDLAEIFIPLGLGTIIAGAETESLLTTLTGVGLTAVGGKIYAALSADSLKTNLKVFGINSLVKIILGLFAGIKAGKKANDLLNQWTEGLNGMEDKTVVGKDIVDVPSEELTKIINDIKDGSTKADIKKEDVDKYIKEGENVDANDTSDDKKLAGLLSKVGKALLAIENFFKSLVNKMKDFFAKLAGVEKKVNESPALLETKAETPTENPAETEAGTESTEGSTESSESGDANPTGQIDEEFDNPEVTESAKTDTADEEVVSESHTGYYFK